MQDYEDPLEAMKVYEVVKARMAASMLGFARFGVKKAAGGEPERGLLISWA